MRLKKKEKKKVNDEIVLLDKIIVRRDKAVDSTKSSCKYS